MAAVAHQFRLLVTLVAVRAVHVAQVAVVRIRFNLSRLLGELLIAVAALADLLFHLGARLRGGLVAGFALLTVREVEVRGEVAGDRCRRERRAEAQGHSEAQEFGLGHFKNLSRLLVLLGAVGQFTAGDTAVDGRSAELSTARVVEEEDAARGIARGVKAGDAAAVKALNFSLGVDERAAEGGRHAALERNGSKSYQKF